MSLNDLAEKIHETARSKGFWEADRNMGEMLMLAVSELSEALEEHRAGNPVEYYLGYGGDLPKPEGVAVEIADCIIRCLDIMHSLGVDIDAIVACKMAYNSTRPHKHGKAY